MTAVTLPPARPAGRGPDRPVLVSARVQLVDLSSMAWPWGVLGSSLAINLVVWALFGDQARGASSTGGLISIFVVQGVMGFHRVVQVFPFACGLGLTRRSFALGAGLLHAGQALLYAFVLTGLRYLEQATDGFGLQLPFFRMPLLLRDGPVEQLLTFTAAFLLVSALGLLAGVVHHRWRSTGLFVGTMLVGAVLAGVTVLLARTGPGRALWDAVAGGPSWGAGVLLPEVVASVAALVAFLLLRRAVP